jgi:hypothetical protein
MSPEQASSSDTIDGRSDIYSLGCVTYEMLVGEPPFKGPSLLAVIARHAVEPPPRIRTVRDTASPALEHVVQRALAKAPADRFSTAQDMRSALIDVQNEQVLQDGASVFAIGAARRPRLALWLRIAAGIAGALALLFVCGLLTIAAFDARVQMPIRFTPSTTNFLLMGARAFVVPAFVAAVILMTLVALRYALSVFNAGMVSLPIVGQGLDTMEQRAETLLSRFRLRFSRRTIYEAFFLASLASAVLVLYAFAPLFQPVYAPEVSILGCLHRDEHRIVQPAISALIVAIVYVWWRLSRREAGRRTGERTAFPHWRIATLVVLLIIAMTLPWRMTWLGGTERVRIGEHRGYLLHETDTELVIYNADRKVTTVFPKGDDSTVQRLAVQGYIFEEASVFESGIPECYSVTSTPLPGSVP